MPRIEPTDRAIHSAQAVEPVAPAPVVPPPMPPAPPAIAREDIHKLHAALHELTECRKLLGAAAARAD